MKLYLLMIALLPIACFAQRISTTETDQFTGDITTMTYDTTFKEGLHCHAMHIKHPKDSTEKVFIMLFYMPSSTTAIESNSYILLKLSNDEVVKTINKSDYQIASTGRLVSSYFALDKADIDKIKQTGVQAIRIQTTDGYEDFNLAGEEQQYLGNIYRLFSE
jgi:hypothetical protein